MCDKGWDIESAKLFCKNLNQESGLPTYDGHFTQTSFSSQNLKTSSEGFMLDSIQCTGFEESFLNCKPQSDDCDNKLGCLAQQGISLTRRNFDTCRVKDRAGIVCGMEAEIESLLDDNRTCNQTLLEKSYIAQAFKLEEEIEKVNTETFRSKSWARYAESIPRIDGSMAVTLVNATKMAADIKLRIPSKGWETIPMDIKDLWSGLVQLAELFDKAFLVTSDKMHEIRYNSLAIHREIVGAVRSAFKKDPIGYLQNSKTISFYTDLNEKGMQEALDSFDFPTNMILELLESLTNEDSFAKEEKFLLKESLQELNRQLSKINAKKRDRENQILTLTRELLDFNSTILRTIDKFCTSNCVEGFNICSKCNYRQTAAETFHEDNWVSVGSKSKEHCDRKETYCKSYGNWSCVDTRKECTKHEQRCIRRDNSCKRTKEECSDWNYNYCSGYESYCKWRKKVYSHKDGGCVAAAVFSIGFSAIADDCNRYKMVCAEHGRRCQHTPYKKCLKHRSVCAEYNDKCLNWKQECVNQVDKCTRWSKLCTEKGKTCVQFKPSGYFCQDPKHLDKSCEPCSSMCKNLKESFKLIMKFSNQVQERALDFNSNIMINELLIDMLLRMKQYGEDIETTESVEEVKNIGKNLNDLQNVFDKVVNSIIRPKRESKFSFSFQDLSFKTENSQNMVQTVQDVVQDIEEKISDIEEFSHEIINFDEEIKAKFLKLFWSSVYVFQNECVPHKSCFKVNVCIKYEKSDPELQPDCVENIQQEVCNVKCEKLKKKYKFNVPTEWRVDNLVSAIYNCGKMISDNIALMKKNYAIQEEIIINRNSTSVVNEKMEFLLNISRGIKEFLLEWSELNDFLSKLSVMNSISGMKAEAFGWYQDNMDELYPDREFDEIFSEVLLKDTKTAVVMNIFVNFVSTTFEKFLETYPLNKKSFVIENFDIFKKSEIRRIEEREKILQDMNEKIRMINRESSRLSNSLDERMKANLTEIENDFICKFKNDEKSHELKEAKTRRPSINSNTENLNYGEEMLDYNIWDP